ncbi:adenylate/guanylate cyclase domain-containing protein [Methylobacterium crusticola]|nr:CHASE3 domain-containing protein [Methylobacterium crusticola]
MRASFALTAVGAVLLLLVGSANALLLIWQNTVQERIARTLAVDGHLMEILSGLQDSETGQRGFLLSGDPSFLAPAAEGRARVVADLPHLEAETQSDPGQQARLAALRPAIGLKLAELDRTLDLDRQGRRDEAVALVRAGDGKATMDEIRRIIGAMRREEDALLLTHQRHAHRIEALVGVGTALSTGVMALLAVLALREAGRRAALSRFLPAEVAPLLERGGSLRLGQRRRAAIAFVDIRDSTLIAERSDPEAVALFVTEFRRCVAQAARATGGVIDKFIGDGALVVFGIPQAQDDDAAKAVDFALALEQRVAQWNQRTGREPQVRIGIGVHCGDVFVGVVGDDDRLEFTVLGDAVNVAARLEQATKAFGATTLISQAVLDAARVPAAEWREVSRAALPGRREAFPVYAREG